MDTDDAFFLDGGRYQSLIRDVIVRMALVFLLNRLKRDLLCEFTVTRCHMYSTTKSQFLEEHRSLPISYS